MKENPFYIEFEKAAVAAGLSEDQALSLDSVEIKQMAKSGETKLSDNFIANMKKLTAEKIRSENDNTVLDNITSILEGKYPDMQAEINRDKSGRVITLHLDGQEVSHG